MACEFMMDGRVFPIWVNRKGYPCICMTENGKEKAYLLHRVVWEQAHGPVPDGHDIHHLDLNKVNWHLDNLAVVERRTHQEMHRRLRSTSKNNKAGDDGDQKTRNHPEGRP